MRFPTSHPALVDMSFHLPIQSSSSPRLKSPAIATSIGCLFQLWIFKNGCTPFTPNFRNQKVIAASTIDIPVTTIYLLTLSTPFKGSAHMSSTIMAGTPRYTPDHRLAMISTQLATMLITSAYWNGGVPIRPHVLPPVGSAVAILCIGPTYL